MNTYQIVQLTTLLHTTLLFVEHHSSSFQMCIDQRSSAVERGAIQLYYKLLKKILYCKALSNIPSLECIEICKI